MISLGSSFAYAQNVPIQVKNTKQSQVARIDIIDKTLISSRMHFALSRLSILLDGVRHEPRWQMKWGQLSIATAIPTDSEFFQLFLHEFAHYIDIYSIVGVGGQIDPSASFYAISWKDPTTKKSGQTLSGFVSWYATTNQYEDFAETFVFYVMHNATFADRALRNDILRKKYLFFAATLFPDGAFQGTDFSAVRVPEYFWDTTKLPSLLQKYLYYL